MKLNKLVSYLTLAGVCSTSLISLPVLAQEGAKMRLLRPKVRMTPYMVNCHSLIKPIL